MGSANSRSSKSKVHGHTASSEAQYVRSKEGKKPSRKAGMVGFRYGTKPFRGQQHAIGLYSSDQHATTNISLEGDESFENYIRRAKQNIRTVSNVGREHGHCPSPAPEYYYVASNETNGNNNNKEDQGDQFSEFIQLAKKKLRTTSRVVGNNGSFRRG